MLKFLLLASAMTISAPVLAQDKPADLQSAPVSQSAPAQTSTDAASTATAPAGQPAATPVDQAMGSVASGQQATPADPSAQAPAQTAAAAPASKADQVAQVVNTEFPSYDKNADGSLSETEFSSWMVALKSASDPTTKAESASTKTWVQQAFASADKDKSKSLSKTELTGFLSQGA